MSGVTPAAGGAPTIRAALAIGPALTCVGIAWTAIAPSTFSSAAVLAGLVASFFATHRFGRMGADAPANDGDAPAVDEAERAADEARAAAEAERTAAEAERVRKEREEARARAKAKR